MRKVGLTGGIAAGKSTAAGILRELGAFILNADSLGHQAYAIGGPARKSLIERFGTRIIRKDGEIDRECLGKIVFANPHRRRQLEEIVWPEIRKLIALNLASAQTAGARVAVIEAAVLLEAGWDDLVDEVWTVEAPTEIAKKRLRKRTGMSEQDANARLSAQMSPDERTARSSLVIENDGGIERLKTNVTAAMQRLNASGPRSKTGRNNE